MAFASWVIPHPELLDYVSWEEMNILEKKFVIYLCVCPSIFKLAYQQRYLLVVWHGMNAFYFTKFNYLSFACLLVRLVVLTNTKFSHYKQNKQTKNLLLTHVPFWCVFLLRKLFWGYPLSGIYSRTEVSISHKTLGIHQWILCIWKQMKIKRESGVL